MSEPTIRVLSLGAGVQSTALLLMAIDGILPKPDAAVFADTQGERKGLYQHIAKLTGLAAVAGIPLLSVTKGDLLADATDPAHKYASIPYFTQAPPGPCEPCSATGSADSGKCPRCHGTGWWDGKGMGRRQCTNEYKLAPVNRKIRELLGAKAPGFRSVPKGRVAEVWIGFSVDEIMRVNDHRDQVSYITKRYPLLDIGMSRRDCSQWLAERGWDSVAKSACFPCPYQGNAQWRDLRDNHPQEWAAAVAFDKAIRDGGANPLPAGTHAFLHSSRVPLDEAPIDKVSRAEASAGRQDQQGGLFTTDDLFSALAARRAEDKRAEEGDPDGCSPWACRSGEPVTAGAA